MNAENITKALHCAQFARLDLQQALETASQLESIILLDLISKAAELQNGLHNLHLAISEGGK